MTNLSLTCFLLLALALAPTNSYIVPPEYIPVNDNCFVTVGSYCIICDRGFANKWGSCHEMWGLQTSQDYDRARCFAGYIFVGDNCVVEQVIPPPANCDTFNGSQCLKCSNRYYLNNGSCLLVDPLCKQYHYNGNCLSCYIDYYLNGNTCLKIPDPFCDQFQANICKKCKLGYYLSNETSKCQSLSVPCKSSDSDGRCTECNDGYTLQDGSCFVTINNCKNYSGSFCEECQKSYMNYLTSCQNSLYSCQMIDWDNQKCLCPSGSKDVNVNFCAIDVSVDENCESHENGICLACKIGYGAINKLCRKIDHDCTSFDKDQGICKACKGEKKPQKHECV